MCASYGTTAVQPKVQGRLQKSIATANTRGGEAFVRMKGFSRDSYMHVGMYASTPDGEGPTL